MSAPGRIRARQPGQSRVLEHNSGTFFSLVYFLIFKLCHPLFPPPSKKIAFPKQASKHVNMRNAVAKHCACMDRVGSDGGRGWGDCCAFRRSTYGKKQTQKQNKKHRRTIVNEWVGRECGRVGGGGGLLARGLIQ